MNREIMIKVKSVYGNDLIYPICSNGKLFLRLTGKKTFSVDDIQAIKDLGYLFKTNHEEILL